MPLLFGLPLVKIDDARARLWPLHDLRPPLSHSALVMHRRKCSPFGSCSGACLCTTDLTHDSTTPHSVLSALDIGSEANRLALIPLPNGCAYKLAGAFDSLEMHVRSMKNYAQSKTIANDSDVRKEVGRQIALAPFDKESSLGNDVGTAYV